MTLTTIAADFDFDRQEIIRIKKRQCKICD